MEIKKFGEFLKELKRKFDDDKEYSGKDIKAKINAEAMDLKW